MLFEDLHWIDGASEAALEDLIEVLPSTRTLLVVNFRPEYHAAWMQKSYYQQLPLLPLGPEAIQQLLNDLLGDDATLGELAALIRERTGGNPFFIEEVVQSLLDHGVLVRERRTDRRAGSPANHPADHRDPDSAHRPCGACGADRSAAGTSQTGAADCRRHREGICRAGATACGWGTAGCTSTARAAWRPHCKRSRERS